MTESQKMNKLHAAPFNKDLEDCQNDQIYSKSDDTGMYGRLNLLH